jgi:putative flippase GtrA
MKKRLENLMKERRQLALYGIFGVLTTVVNYAVYAGVYYAFGFRATTIPNIIAWVIAVLFAYITNRKWVFESKSTGLKACAAEIMKFIASRLFSLLVETALLYLLVDYLGYSNMIVKILLNILVIIINYLLSKFWIFAKPKGPGK